MQEASGPTVLLINPCYNKDDTLGPFAHYITSQLPMSLGFLAGYLIKRVYELCELIDRKGLPEQVKIGFHARGDALDAPLLRRMRESRFAVVLIGFETGSERIMSMVKKGETVREVGEGARVARECGFIVGGQFILGFPTETRKESLLLC